MTFTSIMLRGHRKGVLNTAKGIRHSLSALAKSDASQAKDVKLDFFCKRLVTD